MLRVADSRIVPVIGHWCAAVLIGTALLAIASCNRNPASSGAGAAGLPPPPVKVVRVQTRDLPLYREFVGQTRGRQDVEVRARVQGYLQSINFQQGGDVKAGDLLFTIDKRPYEAALAQAKAAQAQLRSQYQQAKNDAERYSQLTETGVISKQQAEQAASQAKASAAALDAQSAVVKAKEVDLTYTQIRAPISGRIGLTPYSVGDLVGTATGTEKPLATISQLDSVLVRFAISETDYLRYIQDHPDAAKDTDQPRTITDLQLTLADGSIYRHPGMITRADNSIDSTSGTLTVEAQFPNPERLLRAGQYAKVRVGSRILKGAIVVPARAVQEQQGIASVRVVGDDNHVEARQVQIADRSSDFWAITGGLTPGERVVVEGLTRAVPGAVVKPDEIPMGLPTVIAPAASTAAQPSSTGATAKP
jgi:membrane fusion protein (multidrug efflux system)